MNEVVVTKEELTKLFRERKLNDTKRGWRLDDGTEVQIIAIHEKDPKFLTDLTNAKFYKIIPK